MTDHPIIGEIGVAVVPSAEAFWKKFQAQTEAGADEAGRDAGRRLSDGIASQGDDAGRKFRDRMAVALRNVPDVRVDVDTSAAEAKLVALRGEIAATSSAGNDGASSFNALFAAVSTVGPALIPLGSGITGLATSLIGIGTTGALAFKGIQAEIEKNTALGHQFATGMGVARDSIAQLEHTAAQGVLSGFQQSVDKLVTQMPQLNAFIGKTSTALGDIAAHGVGALVSLFTALEPVILQAMGAVDQLAARFESWASGPGGARLFAQFGDDIPLAVAAISNLAISAGHLVEAFTPVGTTILHGITAVTGAIAAIPVPILTAAATAFVALKVAQIASAGAAALATRANVALAASEAEVAAATGAATTASLGLGAGMTGAAAATMAAASAQASAAATGAVALGASGGALARVSTSLSFIASRAIPLAAVAFAFDQIYSHAAHSESVLGRIKDTLGDIGKGHFGNLAGDLANNNPLGQDNGGPVKGVQVQDISALPNTAGTQAASLAKQTDILAGQLARISQPLASAKAGFDGYSAALGTSTRRVQDLVDLANEMHQPLGKDRVAVGDLVVATSTWDKAMAITNGNQEKALALLDLAATQGKTYSDVLALNQRQLINLSTGLNAAAAATGLSTAQVKVYSDALGISAARLASGAISTAQFADAISILNTSVANGSTSVQGFMAALEQFSSGADTAASRGALIGATLKAANGDLLAFTGSMTGVTSANFALTNAFQDQAAAAVSAGRQVTQAQDGVTAALDQQQIAEGTLVTAQQSAVSAQRALTSARVDAKRALEDLHNQVIDGALSERRAVLDLAAARAAEAKAPSASNALSVDESVQRLAEIRLANKRLADEKKAADKAGVEGSQQVASAQAGIVSALKAVSEAQKQQTTAAKGVLAAQQAVTDAAAAQAKVLATSERAAIDAKTGLIDYAKQGAAPLVQQLQAIQDGAEKAAGAQYQHELKTKGATLAADDAYKTYVNQTKGALEAEATQLGLTGGEAKKFADQYFGIANAGDIKKQIELIGQDKVTTALEHILTDLDIMTKGARFKVDADVNPAITKLNKVRHALETIGGDGTILQVKFPSGLIEQAHGGILKPYANGGVSKFADGAHIAQIAPAGAMRLWAEPETGGEAYIPLATAKRQRSEQILADVASRFGGQYQPPGGALKSGGDRSVVVQQTINNPVPEMASVSGPTGLRRAAYALGNF